MKAFTFDWVSMGIDGDGPGRHQRFRLPLGRTRGTVCASESVGSGSSSSQPWIESVRAGGRDTRDAVATDGKIVSRRPASRARHVRAIGTQRFTRVR